MKRQEIFRWTKDQPLQSTRNALVVDNYEGMVVVPPAVFGHDSIEKLGGVMVLLVNDNNDREDQIGTQFVLLRLTLGEYAYAVSGSSTATFAWAALAIPSAVVIAITSLIA